MGARQKPASANSRAPSDNCQATPPEESVAPADRRTDRAAQITFPAWVALPRHGPAAARKVAHTVTFHICWLRTAELADNAQSLIVFLDLDLKFANLFQVS